MSMRRSPTHLEKTIMEAQTGLLTREVLLMTFASSEVIVPSGSDPARGLLALRPVIFPDPTGRRLVVLTHEDHLGDITMLARHCVTLKSSELLQAMPTDAGIIVNPGAVECFDMTPDSVQAMRLLFTMPSPGLYSAG